MANALATPTVTYQSSGDAQYQVIGLLAIDANPAVYVTGGITMNMNQVNIKAQRTPLVVQATGQGGYVYQYVPGTDNSNGKLKVLQCAASGNPLAEISAAAIPAGVSGDTIVFESIWRGMN